MAMWRAIVAKKWKLGLWSSAYAKIRYSVPIVI
jgi:hypothetical protein